jgi:hypothetical protein
VGATLAVVGVGLAVAAANRIVFAGAELRRTLAGAGAVGGMALLTFFSHHSPSAQSVPMNPEHCSPSPAIIGRAVTGRAPSRQSATTATARTSIWHLLPADRSGSARPARIVAAVVGANAVTARGTARYALAAVRQPGA